MGLGLLVLTATTSSYATYAACCSGAFNLESIFDLHNAELNETMELAKDKQFRQLSVACL